MGGAGVCTEIGITEPKIVGAIPFQHLMIQATAQLPTLSHNFVWLPHPRLRFADND